MGKNKIEAFFDGVEKIIDKYPIVGRLLSILLVVGIAFWIIWRIIVHLFASVVWMITGTMEICLIPLYCLIWLLFGKFPMMEIHTFVLEKLKLMDIVYKK